MIFTFKPGDAVRLKPGGPIMTAEAVYAKGDVEMVQCQWFSEGKFHEGIFEAETLIRVKEQARHGTGGAT
jgi:uncharacterized protein YodC (DUF2158 family)